MNILTRLADEQKSLRDKLHESLLGVLHWATFEKIIVAQCCRNRCKSRIKFIKNCETSIGYVILGNVRATCVARKLRDKLHKTLSSVTQPNCEPRTSDSSGLDQWVTNHMHLVALCFFFPSIPCPSF